MPTKLLTRLIFKHINNNILTTFQLSVVLLRPDTNQRIGRLLFERPYPRKMDSCASRMKKEVKHLELIYQTAKNRNGESINKLA
jgi:hypothetical protein